MFRALQERPETLNARHGFVWGVSEAILKLFERLGHQLSPPGSLWSVQAASRKPLTVAWSVLMINSSAQRAKWTDQTSPSSEQTANWSIEKASSKLKTTLSSCHSAWSRSRRRRGRRPHEVFGFASNVLIIDGELRKTFGQCSKLKRASRSLAKTGLLPKEGRS